MRQDAKMVHVYVFDIGRRMSLEFYGDSIALSVFYEIVHHQTTDGVQGLDMV